MTSTHSWLDWLKAKQTPASSWDDHRRNEALELIASATESGSWAELSRHYNGFVREVAVRELRTSTSPEALLALIERLNDWVPQVRELAATGVAAYLNSAHASSLLHALPQLMALAARQRADHGATLTGVRAVLQAAEVRECVHASFLARQGKPACYLFDLLLEVAEHPEQFLREALAHRELNVRLAAVAACQGLAGEHATALLLDALPRSIARLRLRMLWVLVPALQDPKAVLRQALLDPSPSVRSFARWEAKRCGLDATEVLAGQLALPMPTRKTHWLGVLGLATELAVALPEAWWRAALSVDYPSVRLCAVRMPGEQPPSALLDRLFDDSDKVFDAVIAQLGKLPWAALNDPVSASLDMHWHALPATRRRSVLQLLAGWQQLRYLLKRLDDEPLLQDFWLQEITRWCTRQYGFVDAFTAKAQRAELIEALERLVAAGLVDRQGAARVLG